MGEPGNSVQALSVSVTSQKRFWKRYCATAYCIVLVRTSTDSLYMLWSTAGPLN